MNECANCKFNGTYNDDSLLKMGEMRIHRTPSQGVVQVVIRNSATLPMTYKILGNGYFTDSTGSQNLGKSLVQSASNYISFYLSDGTYDLIIPNKYDITTIQIANYVNNVPCLGFDIRDLKFSKNITSLAINRSLVNGDITDVAFPLAQDINFYICTNISGDLRGWIEAANGIMTRVSWFNTGLTISGDAMTLLSQQTNLTELKCGDAVRGNFNLLGATKLAEFNPCVNQPDIVGSVEEFVSVARNTRTTGSLIISAAKNLPHFTYNGNPIGNLGDNVTVSWTEDNITVN